MAEFLEIAKQWFFSLGEQYGVNPVIFGSIYVGAIPFFTASLAWLYRNYRLEKPIVLPALSAAGFFVSAYIYLIAVGKNVPWWVYAVMAVLIGYGSYTTYRKVSRNINRLDKGLPTDE